MCQGTDDEFLTTDDIKQIVSDLNHCTKFQILQFYRESSCIFSFNYNCEICDSPYLYVMCPKNCPRSGYLICPFI